MIQVARKTQPRRAAGATGVTALAPTRTAVTLCLLLLWLPVCST